MFLGRLTPSAVAVGAAAAIARFGWLLPQLFAANYAQGVRYRKPIYLLGAGGRAIALGSLAAVLLWPTSLHGSPFALLALFFSLWTVFSFISGLSGAPYNDVIGRAIPSYWRSRLLATRLFVGGGLAVVAGLLIRGILHTSAETSLRPYGLIFGAGALILALSALCFAVIREPPAPVGPSRPSFQAFLRDGRRVLRRDPRFRLFLYAQLLGGVTKMAIPFYVVQARQVSGLHELEVGTLLASQAIGGIVFNPLWGWWGDRRGKLSLLKMLALSSGISPLLAIVLAASALPPSTVVAGYAVVFFFVGATVSGEIIGDLGFLMEISPDDRRPEYSGYMSALVAPSRLLPLVGGVLLEALSFELLFALAAGAALLARLAVLRSLDRMPTGPSEPSSARVAPL